MSVQVSEMNVWVCARVCMERQFEKFNIFYNTFTWEKIVLKKNYKVHFPDKKILHILIY